jgi:hypothetical protein
LILLDARSAAIALVIKFFLEGYICPIEKKDLLYNYFPSMRAVYEGGAQ